MKKERLQFDFEVYDSIKELTVEDQLLLNKAIEATGIAYAPYSFFKVGAAARMKNGEYVLGANQENASFPAGLCAERVALASASTLYPGIPIDTLAISYIPATGSGNRPISPCGICRQSLQEFSFRTGSPIRLILGGARGEIYILPDAAALLPLAFTSEELRS
ncbi:MAG: cytidine deaminase [Flavitalea sp.]